MHPSPECSASGISFAGLTVFDQTHVELKALQVTLGDYVETHKDAQPFMTRFIRARKTLGVALAAVTKA